VVTEFVRHYNEVRLHSAIGYVTPKDRLEGRQEEIFKERDRRLQEARERRKARRGGSATQAQNPLQTDTLSMPGETEVGSAGEQPAKGYPGQAHRADRLAWGTPIPPSLPFPQPVGR
jgi:hypothetical protein